MTGPVRGASLAALLAIRTAAAQPPEPARPVPPPPPPPSLAEIEDEVRLAEVLAQIANDPAIRVADPALRAAAHALLREGVKQWQARSYERALASFLAAYGKLPSPRILLDIGAALHDMGRLADAANTYQRYLDDPAADPQRAGEVSALLGQLDPQLTLLHVQVTPRGSEVSVDGGPFVPVGQLLVTRVRPGLHLVRIRHGEHSAELTINGFEGETKRVDARAPAPPDAASAPAPSPPTAIPERVSPWLTNGTLYTADSGTGLVRRPRGGYAGAELAPVAPRPEVHDGGARHPQALAHARLSPGAVAALRLDGKLRGAAGALGLAISHGRFAGDLLALRSQRTGAYLGLRVQILSGRLRPYVAAGMPGFLYDDLDSTKLAVGMRGAAGVELTINEHLSVQGDLGYEHFFGVEDTMFEPDVLVPSVGVIGRL